MMNEDKTKTNNDDVMVSVIVLTYHHEKYIRQALDSILMQKVNFRYEVLIGDDASADGTRKILREYQEKYSDVIRLFLHEKNLGATRNAYELLTCAKGKYLATCEGDDYWTDEEKLQTQVDFLEQNPKFVGTAHRFVVVDEEGVALKNQKLNWVRERECFSFSDYQGLFLPGQPSTFVRRNIFLNAGDRFTEIYELHPMIADRTLMLLFLTRGDFYTIKREMSCYRKKSDPKISITAKLYGENTERTQMDYELNIRLEEYAQKLFRRKVVFSERRGTLFTEAVISFVRQRNRKSWLLLKRMIKESDEPALLILFVPFYVLRKVMQKLKP